LLGESYGGFRAAKVARAVQREQGIIISGIIMVSPLLETRFQFGGDRFALGAALELPSLVATELERKHAFSPSALADAEHFALTDYLTALAGPPLTGDAAQRFYARVAGMTGLPVDVVQRSRGFIRDAFIKHLHEDGKIVSHYDATQAFTDPFPESDAERGPDPVLDGPVRALGGLFVAYARDELKFKTPITYTLLANDIAGHWNWGSRRAQSGVSDDLRVLLAFEPSFHLLIIQGRSDMVTPYSDARYVLDHLPQDLAKRTRLVVHRGGHMLYLAGDSRRAMTADARSFYQQQQ
jgi:carboxypeptidase C (cathepsin A)